MSLVPMSVSASAVIVVTLTVHVRATGSIATTSAARLPLGDPPAASTAAVPNNTFGNWCANGITYTPVLDRTIAITVSTPFARSGYVEVVGVKLPFAGIVGAAAPAPSTATV